MNLDGSNNNARDDIAVIGFVHDDGNNGGGFVSWRTATGCLMENNVYNTGQNIMSNESKLIRDTTFNSINIIRDINPIDIAGYSFGNRTKDSIVLLQESEQHINISVIHVD